MGSQPSQSSAHNSVFRGPIDASQMGIADDGCRIDFSGLPCPMEPTPRYGSDSSGPSWVTGPSRARTFRVMEM